MYYRMQIYSMLVWTVCLNFNRFQTTLQQCTYIYITYIVYTIVVSVERKNPLKRDQALNDASNGQMGEEPRSTPKPDPQPTSDLRDQQAKAARKMSRDL
jgi:hypothetical protein